MGGGGDDESVFGLPQSGFARSTMELNERIFLKEFKVGAGQVEIPLNTSDELFR